MHIEKRRVLRAAVCLLGLGAVLGLVLVLRPPCLILRFTGFYCGGCGFCRMMDALLHGDLPTAVRQNAFLLCMLPFGAAYALAEALRYIRGKQPLYRSRWTVPVLGAVLLLGLVFTVLRNLPGFGFLGPIV